MYSFQCAECGKRFEEIVAYDRRDLVTCPACNGKAQVLVSAFAVKGSSGGSVSAAPAPRFS